MNRFLILLSLTLSLTLPATGAQNLKVTTIREVDFKNFTYAWSDPEIQESGEGPWNWLTYEPDSKFRAIRGLHRFYLSSEDKDYRGPSPVISVDAVTYGDLDGDGIEEAVVSLNYGTGGTMNWDYLYVYKFASRQVKLMARMRTGSRGYGGLIRVSVWDQVLAVDFADPDKAIADCCSEGFVRVHYRWHDGTFVEEGERGHGKIYLHSSPPRPGFNDYPVKTIFRGQPAAPVITREFRGFRTMIRRGAKSPVQFAGHYTVPGWGCGTDCNGFVIVDSKTGKVYEGFGIAGLPPRWLEEYGEEAIPRMEFYPDSRLLKINACPGEGNCGLYDYVMVDGKGLRLIRKELLPEEYGAAAVR